MGEPGSLGTRMKRYEHVWQVALPMRVPVIIRVDGRAFHTVTRHMERPFDTRMLSAMDLVAIALCEEIQGAQMAYVQSDEVSVLVHGYETIQTQPWFGNELQKMCSISASVATCAFNAFAADRAAEGQPMIVAAAHFDSRAFLMPEDEVTNYFIWRQQDATRNSIQMVARAHFSHREVHGKDQGEMQEMLFARKGINWNDLPDYEKRGRCAVRRTFEREGAERAEWGIDHHPPVFTKDRDYIEKHVRIHRQEVAA